jgi:hypothetical protein
MRTIAVLVLLAVPACGGDEAPPPAPTQAAQPTRSPIPTRSPAPEPFALARTYESSSASELATRLARSETAIREGRRPGSNARIQQAAYRQLVRTPAWRETVYAELPADLRSIARANVAAGAELRALTKPRTELPPWHIVMPPPSDQLRAHYDAAAAEFGLDWSYLAAIHLSETLMGRIRGDSTAGAKGPMQFLPATWAAYGEGDIEDAGDAIRAAARYLKAHGAPAEMSRAIFAYNHSDHYVKAISLYAEQMQKDPRAYDGYYHWQVYYRTNDGDALLYEGWPSK